MVYQNGNDREGGLWYLTPLSTIFQLYRGNGIGNDGMYDM